MQAEVKLPTGAKLPAYHLQWSQGFRNGRVVFQQEYSTTSRGRFQRTGFIGTDGEVAIPAAFNEESVLSHFQKGLAVITPAKLCSYSDFTDQAVIDTSGEVLASPVRGDTQRMTFPNYAAKTDGAIVCGASPRRYGLLNAAGKMVAAPAWEDAEILSPDLIAIKKNGKFGLVNAKGEEVLPATIPGIDFVDVLSATRIWVRKDGQTGRLDIRSGEFTPQEQPDYEPPVVDHSGDAFVLFEDPQTKLYGIKAKDGTITLPPKYAAAYRAAGNRFWVSNDKNWNEDFALVTEAGQTLTEFEWWYPSKRQMRDGLMLVMKEGGGSGYMDENGKIVIPLTPGRKSDFAHGAAMVWKDGQSGLINPKGEWIFQSSAEVELAEIGYTSDFADYFQHGLALVELPMKWGLMSLEKVSP